MTFNDKTALAILVDFGASHTIAGVYDKNKDLLLLNTNYLQNGMLPSVLYLHANLKIDFDPSNAIFCFDNLKYNFLNQKTYYVDVSLRNQNVSSINEARNIYNNDLKKFINDSSIDLIDHDLAKSLFFEYKNGVYTLKLVISIGIDELLAIFFKRLRQEIFIKTNHYANAIIYAVPAYLSHELRKKFANILQSCDLYPLLELTEPEASLLCYDDLLTNNAKYLVIDSGASTTDLCLVSKQDNKLLISALRGNNDCGGILIDEGIKNYWLNTYKTLPYHLAKAILSSKIFLNDPKNKYEDFYYYEEKINDKVISHSSLDPDFNKNQVLSKINKQEEKNESHSKDPLILKYETNYKQAKVFLNYNELALKNISTQDLQSKYLQDKKDYDVNYTTIYKLSYADYVMCATIFFQRYVALFNDLNTINVQGIVLSGGSNLNLFLINYLKQDEDIAIFKNHIFDSVINGLYVAYNKKMAGKLNLVYRNPIDVVAVYNNTNNILVKQNAILPAHIELSIPNIRTDFKIYLGTAPTIANQIRTSSAYKQPLYYELTPTLTYEELKEENDLIETKKDMEFYNKQANINDPITLRLKIDISIDYVFKITISTNDYAYDPLVINKFAFSKFNLIYLQLTQEEINVYNYLKNIQPHYINQKYQNQINDIIKERQQAEFILAKQDLSRYNDNAIVDKVEGNNGIYAQFKEFDEAYLKLQQDLEKAKDDYEKRTIYEYFLNTAYNSLKTSLQYYYQLQAIISGKEAPFL